MFFYLFLFLGAGTTSCEEFFTLITDTFILEIKNEEKIKEIITTNIIHSALDNFSKHLVLFWKISLFNLIHLS